MPKKEQFSLTLVLNYKKKTTKIKNTTKKNRVSKL